MTDPINAFVLSIDRDEPPPFATPMLCAVWRGLRGDWQTAHEFAQAQDDAEGAWVHAWLHRIEGDLGNADYWYQRARRPSRRDDTREEGLEIAKALIRSIASVHSDACAKIHGMTDTSHSAFGDPEAVAKYAEGPPRNVPGYSSLVPMTRILLAERMPPEGRVLVVGAGGGLELEDFAQAHPGWRFDGVDPSAPMLDLAARRLGPLSSRVTLHEGYVQDAPAGPFDAATCLLTFHFVPHEQRLPMAAEIRRRLKPGAPFVAAHFSVEDGVGERDVWMSRFAAFLTASGTQPEQAAATREKLQRGLPILTPAQDEAILREAGFGEVQLFYVGFTFRGWVAYA